MRSLCGFSLIPVSAGIVKSLLNNVLDRSKSTESLGWNEVEKERNNDIVETGTPFYYSVMGVRCDSLVIFVGTVLIN